MAATGIKQFRENQLTPNCRFSLNTAVLIEGTVKSVKEGSHLVSRTSEAFGNVASGAAKIGELVAEITAASNEQADGIDQVSKGINEMDRVTQRNAANAEELASSMSYFKVGERTGENITDRSPRAVALPKKTQPRQNESADSSLREVDPDQVIPFDDEDFKDF